jgi:DNA-binding transcriptional MocR family regulator
VSIRKLRNELEVLLGPIAENYGAVFDRGLLTERTRTDQLASAVAAGTLDPDAVHAIIAATRPAPEFWRTTLGQNLYRLSEGRPENADTVTAPVAHNVLRVVRQRIDQYVMSGQLVRVPDLPVRVTATSLLTLWSERNPEGAK